ncbi:MAG: bis(5'-nucleosyl)-tetraphosphatase (symmetrical) YqeK [Clostridia bacterium]|nr:bis(5'-nucleosyl)-tetraphosphatase (symmetrical) YqeK [Clostridia bacterium]
MNNKFSEEMLSYLRESVKNEMGEKRYFHTLEVEKMATRLGEIYAPDDISMLRAAALLHDVTKERTTDEHIAICENAGEIVSFGDRKAPKMFHSRTAALVIPTKYPEFATPEIISAVRYHTTGRENMTLAEKIIYLADYIDMSRKYGDCVALRDFFFDFDFENSDEQSKIRHLNDTLIMSYNLTIKGLLEEDKHIAHTTFEARNFLILER